MKALVAGHFGYGNLGDEALLATMVSGLTQDIEPRSLTVVSGNPPETRSSHGVDAIPPTPDAILDALRGVDVVVFGPGGILHDSPMPGRRRRQAGISFYHCIASAARDSGIPTALFNIGVGPIGSSLGQKIARSMFEHAAYVNPRDAWPPTAEELAYAPPTADLAWAFAPDKAIPDTRGAYLAVSLRPLASVVDTQALLHHIADAVGARLQQGTEQSVIVIPMQTRGKDSDVELSLSLRSMIDPKVADVIVPRDPGHAFRLFANASASIAVRRHAAVASLSGNRPTVGIAYDRKVNAVFDAIGASDLALGTGAGGDEILKGLARAESRAHLISDAVGLQRAAARGTIEAFGSFLQNVPSTPAGSSSRWRWSVRRQKARLGIVLGPPYARYRAS